MPVRDLVSQKPRWNEKELGLRPDARALALSDVSLFVECATPLRAAARCPECVLPRRARCRGTSVTLPPHKHGRTRYVFISFVKQIAIVAGLQCDARHESRQMSDFLRRSFLLLPRMLHTPGHAFSHLFQPKVFHRSSFPENAA